MTRRPRRDGKHPGSKAHARHGISNPEGNSQNHWESWAEKLSDSFAKADRGMRLAATEPATRARIAEEKP